MFDSERKKQHQRVLCNKICRLLNETIKITHPIIKDQMITIITDQKINHKIETQATTIDTGTIQSHPIGIITVTLILNIDTEKTHQSIKEKSIKYKQMKKQLQNPQVLITQKIMNYN